MIRSALHCPRITNEPAVALDEAWNVEVHALLPSGSFESGVFLVLNFSIEPMFQNFFFEGLSHRFRSGPCNFFKFIIFGSAKRTDECSVFRSCFDLFLGANLFRRSLSHLATFLRETSYHGKHDHYEKELNGNCPKK